MNLYSHIYTNATTSTYATMQLCAYTMYLFGQPFREGPKGTSLLITIAHSQFHGQFKGLINCLCNLSSFTIASEQLAMDTDAQLIAGQSELWSVRVPGRE